MDKISLYLVARFDHEAAAAIGVAVGLALIGYQG